MELNERILSLLVASGVAPERGCHNCKRSWGDDEGFFHCGASSEQEPRPFWAERKYSEQGLVAMMVNGGSMLPGMDCEKLDVGMGGDCKAWEK